MPLFEFHCSSCNKDFEELVRSADEARQVSCPECGQRGAKRKFSVFAAHGPAAGAGPAAQTFGGCGRCGDPNGPCAM